jgi:DNA modification methylase
VIRLINASAHNTGLDAQSVHCIVTSPPYWGLRAYAGEQRIEWPAVEYSPMPGLPALSIPAMTCGLGEETTPEAYIGHLILVMREMKRVLRDDGTCWVNLGDSYAASPGQRKDTDAAGAKQQSNNGSVGAPSRHVSTLKPKDICLIPARFALAAQADGWYIRNDIIWAKPNPMPESVTDRCTKAHEYVWLMAKSPKYFCDMEAVKEEATDPEYRTVGKIRPTSDPMWSGSNSGNNRGGLHNQAGGRTTRNRRTVWNIATSPYSGAHFATWPPKLVEPMILAGTSARGVCPECGSPWERVVERTAENHISRSDRQLATGGAITGGVGKNFPDTTTTTTTTGWRATCECPPADPIPATVLDCFNGSGTSGTVALDLGRAYIGVDISKEYVTELAEERIGGTQIGFGL